MPTGPPTFVFSHPLCRATQRSIVAPFHVAEHDAVAGVRRQPRHAGVVIGPRIADIHVLVHVRHCRVGRNTRKGVVMRENAGDRDVAEARRTAPRSDDDPLLAETAHADIFDADSGELHVAWQVRVELDAGAAIRGSSGADDVDVRDGDAGRVLRCHARRLAGGNGRATRAVRRHDDREWPGSPVGRVERERPGERLTTCEVHTIARAERSLVDAGESPPRRRQRARG